MASLIPLAKLLLPLIPDVLDVFLGKKTPSPKKQQIIKNAINEHKKMNSSQKKQLLGALANLTKRSKASIVKNAVNEDSSQGPTHIIQPMLTNGDSQIANESRVQVGFEYSKRKSPFGNQTKDCVHANFVELIGLVRTSSTTGVASCVFEQIINPRYILGTMLCEQSHFYQRYFIEKVEIIYIPHVSKLEPGAVIMGIQEDVSQPVPYGNSIQDSRTLLETCDAIEFPIYDIQTLSYQFLNRAEPLWLSSTYQQGIDINMVNQGKIFIADNSVLKPDFTYGSLIMKASIYFFDSKMSRKRLDGSDVNVRQGTFDATYATANLYYNNLADQASIMKAFPYYPVPSFYVVFFEEDDVNLKSPLWPDGVYKAGMPIYAKVKSDLTPPYPINSAFAVLYPTYESMLSEGVACTSTGANPHTAHVFPLFSSQAITSGSVASFEEKFCQHYSAPQVQAVNHIVGRR